MRAAGIGGRSTTRNRRRAASPPGGVLRTGEIEGDCRKEEGSGAGEEIEEQRTIDQSIGVGGTICRSGC